MDAEAWRGPGIYTFTAAISDRDGDVGAFVEFPLTLKVTIDGPAPAEPVGPGPLGVASAAATADTDTGNAAGNRRTQAAARDQSGGAISDAVLVMPPLLLSWLAWTRRCRPTRTETRLLTIFDHPNRRPQRFHLMNAA